MSTLRTHFTSLRRQRWRSVEFDLAASLTMAAHLNEIEAACDAAGILDIEPSEPTNGAAIAHEWESEKLSRPTPATPEGLREKVEKIVGPLVNMVSAGFTSAEREAFKYRKVCEILAALQPPGGE